ncbi:SRPBCC family protein [Runella sp.]|uniref:SRPBCC family protein n=1 Tax=Runella sp. TaxID=1960881 RepID=UPI003D0AF3F8
MPTKSLLLHYSFPGDLARVYECVLNFRKFGELHPHMVEVNELSKTAAGGIEYEVKEEVVLLGFLKMRPEYKAEVIEIEKDKHIRYVSNVKGGINLVIDFTFIPDKTTSSVLVEEKIEIKGNSLLIAYFSTILKNAHLQLFNHLSARLLVER